MLEQNKTLELKKHVAAIHSSNTLSLLQRKIANALLYNAYNDLFIKEEYQIHIGSLCKLIGYDSNDHKLIKKALINLLSTVIEWNLVDGNKVDIEGIWNASSIIADASIDGAICTYSYSNKMRKLLHRPELYGRLNMVVQAKFQSNYGLALYENCIRYQNIGQTPWFELAQFRKLMGVGENKYKIFRDFKTRVLDKALEEVNKYSPIIVNSQMRKQNRQVIAIQFLIKKINEDVVSKNQDNAFPSTTQAELLKLKFGLSKKQQEDVLSSYSPEYIAEKINVVEASPSFKAGKINNLAKYFLSALKDDYQPMKSSKPSHKSEPITQQYDEQSRMHEYRRYQDQELFELFQQRDPVNKETILKKFQKHIARSIYHNIYVREGLSNILIRDQLCLFLRQTEPESVKNILSYAEWVDHSSPEFVCNKNSKNKG
jgi:plasmid replication initiation protein